MLRLLCHLSLALALSLAACGGEPSGPQEPRDVGATDSGPTPDATLSDAGGDADTGAGDADACVPNCDGRLCGSDGCGGSCGECEPQEECNSEGQCLCQGESEEELQAYADERCGTRQCGPLTVIDRCNRPREISCGTCAFPDSCDGSGSCVCVPEHSSELCESVGANCYPLTLRDRCGEVVTVENCGYCSGGEVCIDNVCGFFDRLVKNDECTGTVTELLFDKDGQAYVVADLRFATDSGDPSCALSSTRTGSDAVFQFSLTERARVHVELLPTASTSDSARPMLYIRERCDARSDMVCARTLTSNVTSLEATLERGTWFVWVDTLKQNEEARGQYILGVKATPVIDLPVNDSCESAEALAFSDGVAIASGDTTPAVHLPAQWACMEHATYKVFSGQALYYSFTTASRSFVSAEAWSELTGGYAPSLLIFNGCETLSAEHCATTHEPSGAVMEGFIEPGEWIIAVASANGTAGHFELTVRLNEEPFFGAADCAAPQANTLPFEPSGRAHITGHTGSMGLSGNPTCHDVGRLGQSGEDLVYAVEIPSGENQDLTVILTPAQGSNLPYYLELRRSCGSLVQSNILFCTKGELPNAPIMAKAIGLSPGTYYLWIDRLTVAQGVQSSSSVFALELQRSSSLHQVENDLCGDATALPSSLPTSVTGSTVEANDDHFAADCLGSPGGQDLFYRFTAQGEHSITATVKRTANSPAFLPSVALIQGCSPEPLAGATCQRGLLSTGEASARLGSTAEGVEYTLVVDSDAFTSGEFSLELSEGPPVTNTTCAMASPLVFDSERLSHSVSGDTRFGPHARAAVSPGCASAGNELVYRLEFTGFPSGITLTARAESTSDHPTRLSLRLLSDCAQESSALACAAASSAQSTAELLVSSLTNGSYWLWVDSASTELSGPFSLTLDAFPTELPSGALCDGAILLGGNSLPAGGYSTAATGTTSISAANWSPSCAATSGREVIYAFRPSEESNITLTVSPTAGSALVPALYVRTACESTLSERACRVGQSSGLDGKTTLELRNLLADQLYYVFVDSSGRNPAAPQVPGPFEGPYSLSLTSTPSNARPANNRCASPEPLEFEGDRAYVSAASTEWALSESEGSCATLLEPHSGGELVYSFTLSTPRKLFARVARRMETPDFRPALYLRPASSCPIPSGQDRLCGEERNGNAMVVASSLDAGHWLLFVDGVGDGVTFPSGLFDLEVLLSEPSTLPNSCADITAPLDLSNPPLLVSGNLHGATDVFRSSRLGAGAGPDLVYWLNLGETSRVTAKLEFASISGPALLYFLSGTCASHTSANEVAWGSAPAGGPLTVTADLYPGDYWLVVDSDAQLNGQFKLELDLLSLSGGNAPGTCQAPIPLAWVDGTATFVSNLSLGAAVPNPICTGATGPVRVFSVTLPPGGDSFLSARATMSGGMTPALWLRKGACDSATTTTCFSVAGKAASFSNRLLAPGEWYLFVGAANGAASADFTLELKLGPNAYPYTANSACAEALPIQLDAQGHASINGDSSTGVNTIKNSSCFTAAQLTQPDLVYRLDTRQMEATNIAATVTFTSKSLLPVLSLRAEQNCAQDDSSDLACSFTTVLPGSNPNELSLVKQNLPPGLYYLRVGSYNGSGAFALDVSVTTTLWTGGTSCQTAPQFELMGQEPLYVQGTTVGGSSHYLQMGGAAQPCSPVDLYTGTESFFRIVPPAAGMVKATISPRNEDTNFFFGPVAYSLTDCTATRSFACTKKTSGNDRDLHLEITLTEASPFILVVDSMPSYNNVNPVGSGAFALKLEWLPFLKLTNKNCDATAQLGDGTTELIGTSVDGSMAGQTSCLTGYSGNDFIWRIEIPAQAERDLYAIAAPLPGSPYRPILALQNTCGSIASELSCTKPLPAGAKNELGYGRLSGGSSGATYYLWLDEASFQSKDRGLFSLKVELTDASEALSNGYCGSAIDISPANGLGRSTYTGMLRGRANASSGSCASMPGREVVHALSLPADQALTVRVTSPTFAPAVYVRRLCASAAPENQFGCAAATKLQDAATLTASYVSSGTYAVIVDSVNAHAAGPYTIEVATSEPLGFPANDICASATELFPDATGRASARGTIDAFNDSGSGRCAHMPGPDAVYKFSFTGTKRVTARLSASSGFTPAVYLQAACGTNAYLGRLDCSAASSTGAMAEATLYELPEGEYFVWVDSLEGAASGEYWLDLIIEDAVFASDTCARAIELPLGDDPTSVRSTISAADDSGSGSCAAMPGPDAVWWFELDAPAHVTATLLPSGFTGALYLRNASCESTAREDEQACASGKSANTAVAIDAFALPAGLYHLWVDATSPLATGTYTLTLSTAPAVDESFCAASAAPLSLSGGPIEVDLTTHSNLMTGTCEELMGPEALFRFTLAGDTKFTVTAAGAGFKPGVYIRKQCAAPDISTQRGCVFAHNGNTASLTYANLAAGTYYLAVDSARGASGMVQLSVSTAGGVVPKPANDTCDSPTALALGQSVTGDTSFAANDLSGLLPACGVTDYLPWAGPDLIYSYTPQGSAPFQVVLEGLSGYWNASLWLSIDQCGDRSRCIGAHDIGHNFYEGPIADKENILEYFTVTSPKAGHTYYIHVESHLGEAGPFKLTVVPMP